MKLDSKVKYVFTWDDFDGIKRIELNWKDNVTCQYGKKTGWASIKAHFAGSNRWYSSIIDCLEERNHYSAISDYQDRYRKYEEELEKVKKELKKKYELWDEETVYSGRVRWFNEDKRYGFVDTDIIDDVIVFAEDIVTEGYKILSDGEKVQLKIVKTDRGFVGKEVQRCV